MSSEPRTPLAQASSPGGSSPRWVVGAALVGVAVLAWSLPRIPTDRSLSQLFVEGESASRGFAEFEEAFGTDDVLLIAVERPEGDALTPAVLQFVHGLCTELDEDPDVDSVQALTELSDFEIQTHFGIQHPGPPRPWIPDLSTPLSEDRRHELLLDPLLRRGLVSADGSVLAIWVMLDPSLRHDPGYGERARELADGVPRSVPGAPDARVLVTGAPLFHDAVLRHAWIDAARLFVGAVLCVSLALLVSGLGLRAVVGFLLVWPCVLGALSSLALLTGRSLHVFSGAIPPLLLITGAATFVHCAEARRREAGFERLVGRRCLLATAATILAFLPLALSELRPLRALGLELAAGAGLGFVACRMVAQGWLPRGMDSPAATGARPRPLPVVLWIALGAAALPWFLFADPPAASGTMTVLPPDHPLVVETAAARRAIGSPAALEIVVERQAPGPAPLRDASFLRQLEELERRVIEASDGAISLAMSPLSFVRTVNVRLEGARGEGSEAAFRVTDAAAAFAGRFLFGPYLMLRTDPSAPIDPAVAPLVDPMRQVLSSDGTRMRLGCPIAVMSSAELLSLRRRLELEVFPDLESALEARLVVTGSSVLLAEAERAAGETQRHALVLGAGLVALLFLAIARDLRAWIAALIANGAALLAWRNLLAAAGELPDIHLTVLLATLLGVIVDDTLHVLSAWRCHRGSVDAIAKAMGEVAAPIRRSSIALAIAFAAFAWSELPAYRAFAWLAPAAIGLALLWDLVALPRWLARGEKEAVPLSGRSTS